ncbi:Dihydrolipoamide acetyltransferase component of pyruvate dehydrogenase complex [Granulibacter bethesdensis]|uniref:Acetyltransferase component of pyruvate dehydrogenase complex n=1 Tax=Granulibacter bethesdensis TaxID=364410 RepID=A0AAC9KBW3_9PROT|nr:pyruvate dehydrogenase complex dihydrolipoamide acetyltransferase [Granulibacter bethesdensis]APH54478.1 Dihydrolipoamide acetyltransferase component of pyruvate dehydrogenase complex [Granulibacter bethesdensis]APH62064.1 Dihydrolipoamide acetyltransferase component of pyruvate dehydrogenase complex [Granulibacter bethesdensis]
MATTILMPALSPTMTEGTLARWLKKEGDTITAGDVIAEIETDKATMEVEAVDEGVLGRILVPDGTEGVAVNAPIAILVEEGEAVPDQGDIPVPAQASAGPLPDKSAPAKPEAKTAVPSQEPDRTENRIFASPLARRIAKEAGIDLASLTGSGPSGRILRADVEKAKGAGGKQAPTSAATLTETGAAHKLVPHSGMRRTIARRLTEAKQTIPHFYVTMDVELDALLKLRADLNARSPAEGQEGAFKLSVNDLIIKAAGLALRRVPGVNAAWSEDGILLFEDVDISVAVSIPDGLITPIIRQADRKGVVSISTEMKALAARARKGGLQPSDYQGGGFSISNLGMYGVRDFAAIINPPQAAILAVGAGEQRPVVRDGALAVSTVMSCTLSVDHRVVDGALGAQWLGAFRQIVEDPLSLLL